MRFKLYTGGDLVTGIGAVGGMAMARTYLLDEDAAVVVKKNIVNPEDEYLRFLSAIEIAASQLEKIMKAATEDFGQENGEIFDYQLLMLEDKDFLGKIKDIISNELVNCEYALDVVARQYIELFANMDNDYLKERTSDIADLAKRLNYALVGKVPRMLSEIREDYILAAVDITPSQTAGINKDKVKGIILERGGMSSHSVIIARSMGIPCIVGVAELMKSLVHGEIVLINGTSGEVFSSPTVEQAAEFKAYRIKTDTEKKELERFKHCESKTRDGFEIKIYANITTEKDSLAMIENGGEGVGLFRTEFLYMLGSTPPSEDLQYKVYSNIAKNLGSRPFVIRTLDAGGDKNIPYLGIPPEDNPNLGYRAIRYCLENPVIFKTQIAAILRAGTYGNIHLMLPMLASVVELHRAKRMIDESREELASKGIPHSENIRIGIMMETPAAAVMADRLAREVDFFSIGTNDLTQYLFAADRMNPKVAYLNSYFHPALLRTVYHICKCAAANGIETDICGQAGEITKLVPLWAAMGVNNLSVSIPSIPRVRKLVCETVKTEAVKIMERTLSMDTAEEVEAFLGKGEKYDYKRA